MQVTSFSSFKIVSPVQPREHLTPATASRRMKMMVKCAGCERPILDRYLFNVSDQSWHPECVTCSECKTQLTDKCFSREGKLFCHNDFFMKFGTKCSGCLKGILPSDLVRRARSRVFHVHCFTCLICKKKLATGEELYILDDNRFICKEDYVNSRPQHSDLEDSESGMKFEDEDREDDDRDDELLPGSPSSHLGLGSGGSSHLSHHHHHHSHHSHHHHSHHSLFPGSNGAAGGGGGAGSLLALSSKSSPLSASSSLSDSGHGISGGTGADSLCASSPPSNIGSNSNGTASAGTTTTSLTGSGNDENTPGTKRRGPRTTIKAKQLETLKAAFAATPKPTRHIREQLANETGLNMRVIQVWFQNRRSKERRMKQLNVMGSRRHFFRSPRRAMRPLRPGLGSHDDLGDSPEMVGGPGNSFGYFSESSNPGEFGYPPPQHPGVVTAGGQPGAGYPFDFYGLPSGGAAGGGGPGGPGPGSLYHAHAEGPGSVEQGLPGSLDGSGMGGWPPQTQISPDDMH